MFLMLSFVFLRFYLFLERGEGRERKRGKHWCMRDRLTGCLLHAPNWGPDPQPRHVPWPGTELSPFLLSGQHWIYWATPARAYYCYVNCLYVCLIFPVPILKCWGKGIKSTLVSALYFSKGTVSQTSIRRGAGAMAPALRTPCFSRPTAPGHSI